MKEIKAEILLATYNGEKYIREQIDSILHQKDERWHLTLSDDGSSDGTPVILDEYVRKHPQKISRVYSGRRFGNARDHFYWLIGQCSAEYMLTCDQDDRWYEDKLGKTLEALLCAEREQKGPLLVFSDQTPTDAQLNPLVPSLMRYQNQFFEYFDYRSILMQNVVTGGAMGFNRALANLALQCRDLSGTIMHDWWLAVVAARFGKIVYIDEALGDYRQHGHNSVGAKNVKSVAYVAGMTKNLKAARKGILSKKKQAGAFLAAYGDRLLTQDKAFLNGFTKKRSGIGFYVRHRKLLHGCFRFVGMIVLG